MSRPRNINECCMYNFHRRNESNESWRNRYTPSWKSFFVDRGYRLLRRKRCSSASSYSRRILRDASPIGISLLAGFCGGLTKEVNIKVGTSPVEDSSRRAAERSKMTRALLTDGIHLLGTRESGNGRTEEIGDQAGRRQTDRSRNRNWTRARGTEITAGMASEDEWTTFFARRQVAAIEIRVGQNGGPLPFEASFESSRPIVNNLRGVVTKLPATVRDVFALNWQHWQKLLPRQRAASAFAQATTRDVSASEAPSAACTGDRSKL